MLASLIGFTHARPCGRVELGLGNLIPTQEVMPFHYWVRNVYKQEISLTRKENISTISAMKLYKNITKVLSFVIYIPVKPKIYRLDSNFKVVLDTEL